MREQIRHGCSEAVGRLDKSHALRADQMEQIAAAVLAQSSLPTGYLGWTMVMLASEFWRDQVAALAPSRRLLLLPHCLKHPAGCPAGYDEYGLECRKCGACSIADFRSAAESMGYKVLVAEGSPIVLKIIVSGQVDAIVGVACLNVLEKAIDKILVAGIPCMAVPLLSSNCRSTSVDEDWVFEMIHARRQGGGQQTRSYVHLMRSAAGLFAPAQLERLSPRLRRGEVPSPINGQGLGAVDPIAATAAIAYDFLAKGGKHSRPFITLAVYDALTGGQGTSCNGAAHVAGFPDAVKRTAMSIETFHKASLVHDDIEDDDPFRYGEPAMHRRFGTATAINIGDYLIGLGYRLVSREAPSLGPDVVADILDCLADAHTRLSEGQGAELLWRDRREKRLKPIDAMKIYALKTAPAFEAALYCGARLAGPAEHYREPLRRFARYLGVAFQILNDLDDWTDDRQNKMVAGRDLLDGRPTLLWALALENLPAEQLDDLLATGRGRENDSLRLQRAARLYREAGIFDQARRLIDKNRTRAEQVADQVQPAPLRRLLHYLIDVVLERPRRDEAHELFAIDQSDPLWCWGKPRHGRDGGLQ